MWEGIKNFFSKAWVQWGITLAAVGGAVAYFFKVNDFSRPPIPDPAQPQDFNTQFEKLDPKKPIGVFVFNVDHSKRKGMEWTTPGVNASRNNFIEEMQRQYGDNMMVVDNPTPAHLKQFSDEFNTKFGAEKPPVHFVANHHQGTYDDNKLAEFFASIQGSHKRALVISCGPVSKAYEKSGCDYVMIPAPDGMGNAPELSLEISVGYKKAIEWLAHTSDPEEAKKKLTEPSLYNLSQEAMLRMGALKNRLTGAHYGHDYNAPVVVTPPASLPEQPTPVLNAPRK